MKRVLFLLLAGAGLIHADEGKRPNILFIFSDDQSTKTVSCYPESLPGVSTPNLDSLAKTGIRFSYGYIGSWCMASRATLLTGHHPFGIESMRLEGPYPASEYHPKLSPFWPKVFRENGYQTVQIGKWHTGTDTGWGRDWDHQIVWNRPKNPTNAGAYFYNQIIEEDGVERKEKEYSTDLYTDWACEFIKGRKRDESKPWYMWLCYGAVHGPTTPADRHKGKHKDAPVPVPKDIVGTRPGKPDYLKSTQAWAIGPDGKAYMIVPKKGDDDEPKLGKSLEDFVRQHNDCVAAIDEGVGRLMETLRETGQYDNTLVVFSADQGFNMGEHGMKMKLAPYDAGVRSPLLIAMPSRFAAGEVCDHPVAGVDLVRTFFSLAGIEPTWKMHGRDITPLLSDPAGGGDAPRPVLMTNTYHHYGSDVARVLREGPEGKKSGVPWYVAVMDGRYKYVCYLKKGETEELYDLKEDPDELTNLIDEAGQKENIERLKGLLLEELRAADAQFIEDFPPSKQSQNAE